MSSLAANRYSFLSKGFSLLAVFAAGYLISIYPDIGWFKFVICAIYAGLLLFEPKLGFFFLTAFIPVLDFGVWTGNILFSEYDVLFLLTLAVLFWKQNNIFSVKYKGDTLFYALLIWYVLCGFIGFFDYFSEHFSDDIYQSPLNGIRVGKGFISAWLAWYVTRASLLENYRLTLLMLGAGILCGLLLLALGVLWERHVFSSILLSGNIYEFFETLLDFSSTYRITGFFSGMHVGGTALDGYLVCVLPLVFYIVTRQKKQSYFLLSILVFALGLYSLIVTFTRMTIAGFAISFVISGILLYRDNKRLVVKSGLRMFDVYYVFLFVAVIFILTVIKSQAGYQALLFGIMVFFASIVVIHKVKPDIVFVGFLLIMLFSLGVYGVNDSITESQWHQDVDSLNALVIAVTSVVVLMFLGVASGVIFKIKGIKLKDIGIPALVGGGFLIIIVGMGSTRMTERMQGVSSDLQTRSRHWADVIDSAYSDSFWRPFWGFGMGSMPKLYYRSHLDDMPLPNYRWVENDGKTLLEIGKGGYPYFQKITLKPDTVYNLLAVVKFEDEGGILGVDICHKHILFSDQWQPDCVKKDFRLKLGGWQTLQWSFNSGNLGRRGWLDWPPTLQIHNYGSGIMSVDTIEITDSSGVQILKNSDFDNRLNHWFWISDFEHLPWHSKQLFLQVWLEQGWIGLLLFILLIGFGFRHQWKLLDSGESIPIAIVPSMIAMIGLGLTDEYIDEPQTTLMTFAVFFAALQWPLNNVREKALA
ncbi:hypothetical protein NP590_05750 [Methylomonas sp. SURF-2]|uniref:O-antigen polymerase n=1 Tax=Methylomonas subterranea TaxID=2952225 RepID=A0ABT1TDR9_9GAMM|nr:hypothetical protein [Methylomonas sp. SURF-2]MCQ8103600.1 hypothetical protein [Methylomonas sp. SURF-2]